MSFRSLQPLKRLPEAFTLRQLPKERSLWGMRSCHVYQITFELARLNPRPVHYICDPFMVRDLEEESPPHLASTVQFCTASVTHDVICNYLRDANSMPIAPLIFSVASETQDFDFRSVQKKYLDSGDFSVTNAEIRRALRLSALQPKGPWENKVLEHLHNIEQYSSGRKMLSLERFHEVTKNSLYFVKSTPLVGGNFYFEQVYVNR